MAITYTQKHTRKMCTDSEHNCKDKHGGHTVGAKLSVRVNIMPSAVRVTYAFHSKAIDGAVSGNNRAELTRGREREWMDKMELSENCVWRLQLLCPADAFIQVNFRVSHLTHSLLVQLGIYWCSLNAPLRGITAAHRGYKEPVFIPYIKRKGTGSCYFR